MSGSIKICVQQIACDYLTNAVKLAACSTPEERQQQMTCHIDESWSMAQSTWLCRIIVISDWHHILAGIQIRRCQAMQCTEHERGELKFNLASDTQPVHFSQKLKLSSLMSNQTHYRSYQGQVFMGKMAQPTVSKHWRKVLWIRLQSHHVHPTVLQ